MISRDQKRWQMAAHVVLAVSSALALLPFILLVIISFTDDKTAIGPQAHTSTSCRARINSCVPTA